MTKIYFTPISVTTYILFSGLYFVQIDVTFCPLYLTVLLWSNGTQTLSATCYDGKIIQIECGVEKQQLDHLCYSRNEGIVSGKNIL